MAGQGEEDRVVDRLQDPDPVEERPEAEALDAGERARVEREHDGQGQAGQRLQDRRQLSDVVSVLRPMDGGQHEPARLEPEVPKDLR